MNYRGIEFILVKMVMLGIWWWCFCIGEEVKLGKMEIRIDLLVIWCV